ncbi:MAG: hypothetical protein ACREYE_13640, partial [Gammaproteobacteria bacterium]
MLGKLTNYLGLPYEPEPPETFAAVRLTGPSGDKTGVKRYRQLRGCEFSIFAAISRREGIPAPVRQARMKCRLALAKPANSPQTTSLGDFVPRYPVIAATSGAPVPSPSNS